MAEKTDEIEVVIDEKLPDPILEGEIVISEAPTPLKEAKTPLEPEEGIAKLKENLENERKAKEQAEQRALESDRRAREEAQRAAQARSETQDSQLSLVTGAIDTVKQSQAIQKDRLRDAMASGDFDAAADIQLKMSENAAKLMEMERGKVQLEERAKNPPQMERQRHSDPVEDIAVQLSPRSAAWIRTHPDYARDPQLYSKVVAADGWARASGYAADSDAYFESVEKMLGVRDDVAVTRTHDDTPAPQRRPAPAAAPPSRSLGTNGATRRVIRLTAEQAEFAEMNGQSPEEYAHHLEALRAEGKIQ